MNPREDQERPAPEAGAPSRRRNGPTAEAAGAHWSTPPRETGRPESRAPDRKESGVRRMLRAGPHPPVPPDLGRRAAARGRQLLLRRRLLHRTGALLALVALLTLLIWAGVEHPWRPPPARTTPPVAGY
ncbi:hypothetical protein ACIQU6_14140 [Streptomyces sp. NPDC090442]|uniref:hypothetical protein n=1 Tax=Streptomyces sp. NPDC090442 TaxID=3365962 RepID=UPI003823D25C